MAPRPCYDIDSWQLWLGCILQLLAFSLGSMSISLLLHLKVASSTLRWTHLMPSLWSFRLVKVPVGCLLRFPLKLVHLTVSESDHMFIQGGLNNETLLSASSTEKLTLQQCKDVTPLILNIDEPSHTFSGCIGVEYLPFWVKYRVNL